MTSDYEQLVKALRHIGIHQDCNECEAGRWYNEFDCCIFKDAADAIEALQAENTDIREELFISQRKYDEFTMVASVQNAMLAKQLPKRGEWVMANNDNDGHVKCSLCGKEYDWDTEAQYYNYCPRCGSHMVGENDERN